MSGLGGMKARLTFVKHVLLDSNNWVLALCLAMPVQRVPQRPSNRPRSVHHVLQAPGGALLVMCSNYVVCANLLILFVL